MKNKFCPNQKFDLNSMLFDSPSTTQPVCRCGVAQFKYKVVDAAAARNGEAGSYSNGAFQVVDFDPM